MEKMATINDLVSGSSVSLANTVRWRKMSSVHYEAVVDGNTVRINRATYSIKINNGEWQKQFRCNLTDLKAKAIRLVRTGG